MRDKAIRGWTHVPGNREAPDISYPPGEEAWLERGRAFFRGELEGLAQVDSARTARVFRSAADLFGAHRYYFKQYLDRDQIDPLKNIFRASRARRAVWSEQICEPLGFHVPRSVCLIEKYTFGRLRYAAIITEAIEDAPILRDWLTRPELGLMGDRARRQVFLSSFAHELAAWHAAGLFHGDLRFGNVLAQPKAESYVFYWLDNERTRRYERLSLRQRVNNLMRINFEPCGLSNSDRLRFWNIYRPEAGMHTGEETLVAKQVRDRTLARRKKHGWA